MRESTRRGEDFRIVSLFQVHWVVCSMYTISCCHLAAALSYCIDKHCLPVSRSADSDGGHNADSNRHEQHAAIHEIYRTAESKKCPHTQGSLGDDLEPGQK